jgi:hypothetical protein
LKLSWFAAAGGLSRRGAPLDTAAVFSPACGSAIAPEAIVITAAIADVAKRELLAKIRPDDFTCAPAPRLGDPIRSVSIHSGNS